MSLKPNQTNISIHLSILMWAQFKFYPWVPFYVDMPLFTYN